MELAAVPVLFLLLPAVIAGNPYPDCVHGPLASNPVCNTSANFLDRAKALVNAMTLEEMVNNTVNASPGVPRLGLPPYEWWSEALHGVASSPGVTFETSGDFSGATSFPEPILMSAAFDDDLIFSVASTISTEARAFGNTNHSGLDFFTPNINPFKDPRWGRGQETPGEDPLHISRYVYQLITGLQGGVGPSPYYKIIADCKHFAAYDLENWEGNNRMAFNAIVSTQDLAEFYTPSFQSCVRDAKAGSVMCSYNAVNGVPACGSPYLLQDLVRDYFELGNDTWITSDCDAVGNIFDPHNYTTTLTNASAVALLAGTDVDCGTSYSETLGEAVSEGLVSQSDVERALVRLYGSLVRLGYFDPAESVPYRALGASDVNTPAAQTLAYTAAVEGIVLLKNDGLLPLSSNVSNIALIGPWANATTQMQGNYEGIAPFLISPLDGFTSAGFNVSFTNGTTISGNSTSGFADALSMASAADVVVYVGGIDDTVEAEGQDRTSISWPGNQLALIGELGALGKPFVVIQMGGGQVDDTELKANSSVNALLWGGYPGQAGGKALADIITGAQAPAGRLPTTQYPASYVNQVAMTDMSVRPSNSTGSPGRTYKWYTGTPVFEFGFGLHYTTFDVEWAEGSPAASYSIQDLVSSANLSSSAVSHVDSAILDTFTVQVTNTGNVTSDYVALLFSNTTAGPSPAPLQELVSYARVKGITPGASATASLNVTLGTIARVDEDGNSIIHPGVYNLWVDTKGQAKAVASFELTGDSEQITTFPTPHW